MANPWYAFYPGDYGRDTAHLSMAEDGAYRRLLDHVYSTEGSIPRGFDQIFRICRAFTKEEQNAARSVLSQFFTEESDGWHNARADRQLAKLAERQAKLSDGARKTNEKRWGRLSPSDSLAESPSDSPSDSLGDRIPEPEPQPQPEPEAQPEKAKVRALRAPAFTPPSLEEVTAYCQERGNLVDPQRWLDHYMANGWMVGRNHMKDWRAAIRKWEKNGYERHGKSEGHREKQPTRQVERFNHNLAEIDRAFGAELGEAGGPGSPGQTPRVGARDTCLLEDKIG